ncbi:MAG: acyltransferase [Bacteroidetes bacterium]|nr:acyltransferase [Bacteroidota bacterium]
MKIPYRPDIDGLRAIAVLGVLLYHLNHRLCPGGFTGVDIFFVISGYLITSIIIGEIQANQFSLTRFYERRIRRILPAYFFLLLFTSTFAYLILTPVALEQYGKAMSHSLLFISNFLFAEKIDYFAKTFNSSPLLHTWSLAVEEQFYLIWPLALSLIGASIFRRIFKFIFLIVLGLSFIISEVLAGAEPKLSFFMIYSRAWELGIGAMIALPFFPSPTSKKQIEFLSTIGILFILTSFLLVNNNSTFPGISASFAALGTAFIIYSGEFHERGYVHRILSLKPLVYIGLISYSLYLWHWPLITFTKYYFSRELYFYEMPILGTLSIIFAYLSFRFIEKPFRKRIPSKKLQKTTVTTSSRTLFKSRSIFIGALTVSIFLLGFSISVEKTEGLPFRFTHMDQPNLYSGNPFRESCHLSRPDTELNSSEKCSYNYGKKKAIIWGDSHADHFMPALQSWAQNHNIELRQISKSACAPIVGEIEMYRLSHNKYTRYSECENVNGKIMQLIEKENIEIVLLAGRWAHFFPMTDSLNPEQYLLDATTNKPSDETTTKIFKENFLSMISTLTDQGVEVIILGQVPFFTKNPAECYLIEETPIKNFIVDNPIPSIDVCSTAKREINMQLAGSLEFFLELHTIEDVTFFDPVPYFCDETDCRGMQKNKILYSDSHHLNVEGAKFLAPFFTLMQD